MEKIFYTKTIETAKDLKLDYSNNAGIDLYPDVNSCLKNSSDFYENFSNYYDFYSSEEGTLKVLIKKEPSVVIVDTPYVFAFPKSVHGIVHGRSGNFFKSGINVFNGVIDSSYRGSIKIGLIFNKKGIYNIDNEKAVAQLVLVGVLGGGFSLEYVDKDQFYSEFFNTERKDKGFGSSGYIS
jgi:dUTPase